MNRSSKRTAKAVGVAGVPQPRGAKRPKPALSKVVEICKTIQIAQGSGTRLCFLIDEEALWQEQGRQSDYSAALLENTISLSDISMDYEARVTDKTRLILAVIFGYTLLYHFGTSWLQDWNRDKIVFLRSDRHVPLKPFLLYNYANCQGEELVDPNQVHWYPEILSLGIILLELHLQTPIIAYLRPDGLSAEEKENVNLPFFLAQEVLEACKDDLNRHYRAAINACLQPSFGDHLDEDDSDYDIQFRREIYNEIVKPLEKDLEDCFGDIVDVEKLDDEAKNLDIFNFGQRIHLRSAHSTSTANVTNETMMSAQPAPSMLSPTSEPEQRLYVLGSPSALSPVRTPSPMRHMLGMNTRGTSSYVDAGVSNLKGSLFDGMITDIEESIDHPGFGVTNNWFERLEKLFHSKMKLNDNVQTPVKIAILDSGIDLKHPGIRLCRPRIKDVRSWVNGSKGEVDKTSGDSLGHGTHVAGLIFAMAPLAEVYVAKITCGSALENTDHIAKVSSNYATQW